VQKLTTRNSLLGIQLAVTEESQAQTKWQDMLFWSRSCPRDTSVLIKIS
jgi:hypothetical protein